MKKKKILLMFSFILFAVMFCNITKVKADGVSEAKTFLIDEYNNFFNIGTNLQTYSTKSGKLYNVNTNYLLSNSFLFYGNANDVTKATTLKTNQWYPTLKTNRFLGITVEGSMGFPNNNIPEDFDTSGNVKGRAYISYPYNEPKISNNSYLPKANIWNFAHKVQVKFMEAGKFYTLAESEEIINFWLAHIDDNYSRNHEWYRKYSKNWKERNTNNHWLEMTAEKRRRVAYIIQPPTEITFGMMAEWHVTPNGDLYDLFAIFPTSWSKDNFTAIDLKGEQIGDILNLYFTVKNKSLDEVDTLFPLPSDITINVDGNDFGTYQLSDHGIEWKKDESKDAFVGQIDMSELNLNQPVKITANFNPNEEEDFEENMYTDNTITKTFYKKKQAKMCKLNGNGESKTYSVRVAVWSCDEDGCWVSSTYCDDRTFYLTHDINLEFNEDKQNLLGIWSSNSNGHNKYKNSIPNASKIEFNNDESKIKWKERIKKHEVPKIDKLKRVIRAGRSLQIYGTMEVQVKIQSYEGESDLNNKKDRFVVSLIDELKNNGVEFNDGVLKNNRENKSVKAQKDSNRIKVGNYYVEYEEKKMTKQKLGSDSCKVINVYTKEYNFIIPVKSKNEGGEQVTKSGDFQVRNSYQIGDGVSNFFTSVNTMNGTHGINFSTLMDGKKIDSSFYAKPLRCDSKTEVFGVQGNIYDDVRSEEVTDKVNEKNWDW